MSGCQTVRCYHTRTCCINNLLPVGTSSLARSTKILYDTLANYRRIYDVRFQAFLNAQEVENVPLEGKVDLLIVVPPYNNCHDIGSPDPEYDKFKEQET